MLTIKNLAATVGDKIILHDLNLTVKAGEVHAIMGPNGSGKSTLGNVLAGREGYTATAGTVEFLDHNLFALSTEERARKGLFLSFQYPIEIPGVTNIYFLRAAVNAVRKSRGDEPYDAMDFIKLIKEKAKFLHMDEGFLYRDVNKGFSGGEKKRNEILQLLLLEPKLAILDEIDSGLDIDALKIISDGINQLRRSDRAIILVTHYQRLLDHVIPDYVHVLSKGKIVKSGGPELAKELEQTGYAGL
ncbi:MAG: Fe-S cluster assembly ATPase SufC [Gammaproteobacteria bacterium]|nr:Fe-S cluster assembly ATPase SufC [Gammaproteobacteria bacterium]